MTPRLPSLALLILSTITTTAPLAADEVVLKDGTVHVGKTRKKGQQVEIRTLDGVVRVATADVDWQRTRNEQQLLAAFAKLANRPSPPARHLELAHTAKRWGLYDKMWLHLGTVLNATTGTGPLFQRTRRFMTSLEPVVLSKRWRNTRPVTKMSKLLGKLGSKSDLARFATISELLSSLRQIGPELRKRSRQVTNPLHRLALVRAIYFQPDNKPERNPRFLYRTPLLDRSSMVREQAMRLVTKRGDPLAAIAYLAPLLAHGNATVRIRTAQALAALEHPAALPHVARVRPFAPRKKKRNPVGGSTRAHMIVTEQRAFVRDFDVEIAQAAAVANPNIGVVQAATALDVTVIAVKSVPVEVLQAHRKALTRLTGKDPGADATKWPAWAREHAPKRKR